MDAVPDRTAVRRPPTRSRQYGLTLISFVVVVALAIFTLYIVARLLPAYTEHGRVVRVIRTVATDYEPGQTSAHTVREQLFTRLEAAKVTSVHKRDVRISRRQARAYLSVSYEVPVHLFGHLDVVAKFHREIALTKADSSDRNGHAK